ncbi:biogenesis of lysosome-related organelles complex 1 subunit 5 isoform X2 [Gadus macrocephalus]|uniref:biogenesis of lysosome-related organelles complex 1 subunit 5 isoform X2 n=1 Tax=Gadus macrocephalus TaxID=80720 RepID=UPI0028CB6780|nr:biogenesis of lysosome-related organelles complex 1 subunit 5 isoform X2 [Gadus macrocephalus]
MDKIAKDVGDIQSRLIDHRPITQGEIRYFVREFEEKRGYREGRLLENINKMVVEANEQVMPKCLQGMHEHLFDVSTRLEAANHMAQRVQQRELDAHQLSLSHLMMSSSSSSSPSAPSCRRAPGRTRRPGRSSCGSSRG